MTPASVESTSSPTATHPVAATALPARYAWSLPCGPLKRAPCKSSVGRRMSATVTALAKYCSICARRLSKAGVPKSLAQKGVTRRDARSASSKRRRFPMVSSIP